MSDYVKASQEKFVDEIISSLKDGIIPWKQPWNYSIAPYNGFSKSKYNGINKLRLSMVAKKHGWSDPRWFTYKQAKERGYFVRRGEKSTDIYKLSILNNQNNKEINLTQYNSLSLDEKHDFRFVTKVFHVFNAKQLVNIREYKNDYTLSRKSVIAEQFLENIQKNMNIKINHEGDSAYYSPLNDEITLPIKQSFNDELSYYTTAFHEIAHATSSPKRLNRNISTDYNSDEYAIEELNAELSSAFLGIELNLPLEESHTLNHKAYIKHWINILNNNHSLLFNSIREAEKISSYILEKGDYLEIINEFKEISSLKVNTLKNSIAIIDYARDELGFNIIKNKKKGYTIAEHKSCKISDDNKFYRFSRGLGGSIIDFVAHFENLTTAEAIYKLKDYYLKNHPEVKYFNNENSKSPNKKYDKVKPLTLPNRNIDNSKAIEYLSNDRGIDLDVIELFLDKAMLYLDEKNNCCFVGYLNNTPQYAFIRSTYSNFKGDVLNSFKEVGIYYSNNANTLVINESVIDQMSYMSMLKEKEKYDFLSVQGVANSVSAIKFHMSKRNKSAQYDKVIISLDNDIAGIEATKKCINYIKENYEEIEISIHQSDLKDWNEELIKIKGLDNPKLIEVEKSQDIDF